MANDERQRRGILTPASISRMPKLTPATGEHLTSFYPAPSGQRIGVDFQTREGAFFTEQDRENHIHVVGSTGTGKSNFLELMIRHDIEEGEAGLCLIDPHGSLYDAVVRYLAQNPSTARRVILFNPAGETERILGFNPVPSAQEGNRDLDQRIGRLLTAILKVSGEYNASEKPRLKNWLETILYTLFCNNLTLVESEPLLSTRNVNEARDILISRVNKRLYWEEWEKFKLANQTGRQTYLEAPANRLREFLRSDIIRLIIGQMKKTINFSKIMQERKILLCNLSQGDALDDGNTRLLGTLLVNEIFRAAMKRPTKDKDPRLKPFYLYIDEFGNFVTRDIAKILDQTRKFRVFSVLAHQHLSQVKTQDEEVYASVMGNCKVKVVFGGLSDDDAAVMTKEVQTGYYEHNKIKRYDDQLIFKPVDTVSEVVTFTHNEGFEEIEATNAQKIIGAGHTQGVEDSKATARKNAEIQERAYARQYETGNESRTSHESSQTNRNTRGNEQSDIQRSGQNQTSSNTQNQERDAERSLDRTISGQSTIHSSGQETLNKGFSGQSVEDASKHGKALAQWEKHGGTDTIIQRHQDSTSYESGQKQIASRTNSTQDVSGTMTGKKRITSDSVSKTFQPRTTYEETHIPIPVYWTLDELEYLAKAALKNQNTGETFIKIFGRPPIKVKVDLVDDADASERSIDRFRRRVFEHHAEYYLTPEEAESECANRQRAAFGFELDAGFEIIDVEPESEETPQDDNPFNQR